MMRLISLMLLWTVSCSLALAQGSGDDSTEKKLKRCVRILVMGERPAPAYEKRGELYVEVDPDLRLIPPTFMELDSGDAKTGSKKPEASMGFSLNQVFRLERYQGPSTLSLTFKNPHVTAQRPVKVSADLGQMIHPLVIVSADAGSEGWSRPRVAVLDVSMESLPGGSGLIVNHSKWPVRVGYGDLTQDQPTGVSKLLPKGKIQGVVPVQIEMKTRDQLVRVFSNRYMLAPEERLLLFVDDTRNVAPNIPPLMIRFATDSIKVMEEKKNPEP